LSFTSAFSFLGLMNMDTQNSTGVLEYVPYDMVLMKAPGTQSGMDSLDNAVNSSLPQATPAASANPMQIWMDVLSLVWLAGIIVLLFYSTILYIKTKRRLQTATLVRDNIYESDRIGTAFVCGFIHPKIYIPLSIGKTDISYILEHERTHIRRRDYIIKPLAFLALILHWFNPMMWLSFKLMSRDMEMSCDESVLRRLGDNAKGGYAGSLLSMSVRRISFLTANPLAFGESHVKARIKNVLSYRKPVFWVVIVAVLVLLSAAFLLLANPQAGFSNLKAENVESMTWTAERSDNKQTYAIDTDEWTPITELINTAKRSRIPEAYRPTFDELYPVHYTLSVKLKKQADADSTTYTLLLYNHKDWDIFHGEYEYKLALTRSTENGESEIWGLPYAECYRILGWFREKSDSY